jgi:1,4-alpha-glucan branching enzyme
MAKSITQKAVGKQQTFFLTPSEAKQLVGDFTEWNQSPAHRHQDSAGYGRITITLEQGGSSCRFIVDGEWRADRESPAQEPNPGDIQNALRQILGKAEC